MNLTYGHLRRLPVPTLSTYAADPPSIVPRVVELPYTARDIKAFTDDVWRENA